MSSTLSVSSNPCQRLSRSRSSSVTESASPESTSSDSHSSSDPDTHLSSISPWLQIPSMTGAKATFGMDIDATSNPHMMELDPELSFEGGIHELQALSAFQGCNFNLDELVLTQTPTNTKSDMLMLEEIIRDGMFDPASSSVPPFSSFPTLLPAFRDALIPPHIPQLKEPQPEAQPNTACIDPSSTQTQAQPQPTTLVINQPPIDVDPVNAFKTESAGAISLSACSEQTVDDMSSKHEPLLDYSTTSCSLIPRDSSPSDVTSANIVHPPKDVCLELPIFFPSVPSTGTKSRVETQIKLRFELGIPSLHSSSFLSSPAFEHSSDISSRPSSSSSVSNSLNTSPALGSSRELLPAEGITSQQSTYDRVGTYKFLRLPPGTATKRRVANSASAKREPKICDADSGETLQMTADVMCCSPPHALVQSCASCQSREAKRTARKLAARVRPPPSARLKPKPKGTGKKAVKKAKEEVSEVVDFNEEAGEEPNVDGSILQFNCAETMDFSGGTVVLPMRITCYCRHHKEKIGFNIVFTLQDHMGRVVGKGTTPPILITDDHKSTNAVFKLPPMHPLRQAFNPSTPLPAAPSPTDSTEEPRSPSPPVPVCRAPTKRRDADMVVKKHRPKPYDGRPGNRAIGVGPGIEGRQGVVLALHPAHARLQAATQSTVSVGVSSSPPSRTDSSPATRSPTPSYSEASYMSPLHSLDNFFAPQQDVLVSSLGSGAAASHPPSPRTAGSSLPSVIASSPSSLSSSCVSHPDVQQHLQSPQTYYQENQATVDTSPFTIYPALSGLPSLPKIHRLIPSSGPTTGGIEITVLGSNFHPSLSLECVFGGAVASSTHRWSDNTLVCVLPPRATPGIVNVELNSIKQGDGQDETGVCLFNYVDESDRQLMELALQVVGLKMTGKIEEARNVAMRIVGNTTTHTPTMTAGELTQMSTLSETSFVHHSLLGSLSSMDLETLIIKLLTLLDVSSEDGLRSHSSTGQAIDHRNATGQTLLHLAVLLALPALASCLLGRSIDVDARNTNGMTALHFAAMTGWKEGVEILLAEGADATIPDSRGLTPAQCAKSGQFEELENLLEVRIPEGLPEGESGDDGDDEAWHTDTEESDDALSPSWSAAPPQFIGSSLLASSTHPESSPDEFSEREETRETPTSRLQVTKTEEPSAVHEEPVKEKPVLDEKHDTSFVERLQRNLPQGILPNVQIPGFPQIQLPDMLAAPWGALPQIPVFPVFVPIPNLPHLPNWPAFPWPDALSSEKKERRAGVNPAGERPPPQQQQPPFAMLWTAYDSLANNAWRAQWEKWTAQVTALQNANNRGAELPPYSPRSEEKQVQPKTQTQTPLPTQDEHSVSNTGVVATDDSTEASPSRSSASKATRRVGYSAVKISETEVDSYHYRPKKQVNKQDRMLVLFWIPILFLGLAYAIYTTLPVAIAGISRATKRMLPQPLQRDQIRV